MFLSTIVAVVHDNPYQPPSVEEVQEPLPAAVQRHSGFGNVVFALIGLPIALLGLTVLAATIWRFAQDADLSDYKIATVGIGLSAAIGGTGILTVAYGLTRSPRILRVLLVTIGLWMIVLILAIAGAF